MSPHRPNTKGFTLIELLLLLVIIAITTAIVAPSLSGFGRARRLDNASTRILAVAQWARTQSISEGRVYRLYLDSTSRTYWLMVQLDDGTFDYLGKEFGRVFTLPEDVEMTADVTIQPDGTYIEFEPTGRSDPAAIRLVDSTTGNETDIGALSATEPLHVLNDEERLQMP